MKGGDTFLRGDPTKHLWVVISDPVANPSDPVLIVNLTKPRRGLERVCILRPADHRFVKQESVVYYRMAEIESNASLDDSIKRYLLDTHDPMKSDVLQRIRMGAKESKGIARGHRKLLIKQGIIE